MAHLFERCQSGIKIEMYKGLRLKVDELFEAYDAMFDVRKCAIDLDLPLVFH